MNTWVCNGASTACCSVDASYDFFQDDFDVTDEVVMSFLFIFIITLVVFTVVIVITVDADDLRLKRVLETEDDSLLDAVSGV
jgi:hypothetical protein